MSAFRAKHNCGSSEACRDVLLKKLAVVAAMLAVAYFNCFIAMPRLRAASSK